MDLFNAVVLNQGVAIQEGVRRSSRILYHKPKYIVYAVNLLRGAGVDFESYRVLEPKMVMNH